MKIKKKPKKKPVLGTVINEKVVVAKVRPKIVLNMKKKKINKKPKTLAGVLRTKKKILYIPKIKGKGLNPWLDYVKKIQKKYDCSYKEAMVLASKSYKKEEEEDPLRGRPPVEEKQEKKVIDLNDDDNFEDELKKVVDFYKSKSTKKLFPFVCTSVTRPFYLLHILKRNNSDCTLDLTKRKLVFIRTTGKRLHPKYKTAMLKLIKNQYEICKKTDKILLVPIQICDTGSNMCHENMLIFNTIRGECERFEPHGKFTDMRGVDSKRIDKSIEKFVDELNLGLKYISAEELNLDKGLQYYESQTKKTISRKVFGNKTINEVSGFCGAWCFFYADMRLKFPKVEGKKLVSSIQKLLGKNPEILRKFIRGFTEFLRQEVADLEDLWILLLYSKQIEKILFGSLREKNMKKFWL